MSFDRGLAIAIAGADLVVLGPAPPLRGGIAQHTERLAEAGRAAGLGVVAASFRRLYPASLFPGRRQRTDEPAPDWSREVLDVLAPSSWLELGAALEASSATVAIQWWHPVTAAACAMATRRIARERLVAICHNVTPHEPFPGAARAARFVLSRCGRVVCHSRAEAARVSTIVGGGSEVVCVPLACLVREADLAGRSLPELATLDAEARLVVAAGHVRAYKGVDLLLRAWSRARRPADARLVVVGESYLAGREARAVVGMLHSDHSIIAIDRYVDDAELVHCLRSAEVVVAAHRRASQSGIVPLARELGVACIVSDAGGLAEQAAGSVVVRAGSEEELRVAIERRLAAPRAPRPETRGSAASRSGDWLRVVEAIRGAARPTARPACGP
jgi:D-inositol-3-phosphate glycosyltransferase